MTALRACGQMRGECYLGSHFCEGFHPKYRQVINVQLENDIVRAASFCFALISFSASESNDPDGSTESFSWEFGDVNQGSGETVSNQYAETGSYTAKVTVTDDSEVSDWANSEVDLTPTTFEIKIENVSQPAPLLKSEAFTPDSVVNQSANTKPPLQPGATPRRMGTLFSSRIRRKIRAWTIVVLTITRFSMKTVILRSSKSR